MCIFVWHACLVPGPGLHAELETVSRGGEALPTKPAIPASNSARSQRPTVSGHHSRAKVAASWRLRKEPEEICKYGMENFRNIQADKANLLT